MGAAIAIAVGVWWNANTVSHLFIHRPFFRRRAANACVAALLTAALGFPQSLWRDRHLAHHRGVRYRFRFTRDIALQTGLVAAIWIAMALAAPEFFTLVYLPGYVLGLTLCAIHGYYEHAGGTTSYYGRLYNVLCFNDGYHVEHHRHPSAAWSTLPRYRESSSPASAWPAPLRWLEMKARNVRHRNSKRSDPCLAGRSSAALERARARSRRLQRWVVRAHARAFEACSRNARMPRHVAIVGGGLFPRTAMVLRRLLPDARLTIVDAKRANLDVARAYLQDEASTSFTRSSPHLH
jgi:fatty acid desaturase